MTSNECPRETALEVLKGLHATACKTRHIIVKDALEVAMAALAASPAPDPRPRETALEILHGQSMMMQDMVGTWHRAVAFEYVAAALAASPVPAPAPKRGRDHALNEAIKLVQDAGLPEGPRIALVNELVMRRAQAAKEDTDAHDTTQA